jgi:nitroimidazol reductase NimA-like FMN-containing flavoprotein (pyridoxamine 5'-phosphate oxidase superfamily)
MISKGAAMKRILPLVIVLLGISGLVLAKDVVWPKGGPAYLYIKPTEQPVGHPLVDEQLDCGVCHRNQKVDTYTAATQGLSKSKIGTMPRTLLEQWIGTALMGKGNYREIYVLGTSFKNVPLTTVMEFRFDPSTFSFYGISIKQTEKLFHMASNHRVSLATVKHSADYTYYRKERGVQIQGRAQLLRGSSPGFEKAARIYLPTMPMIPNTTKFENIPGDIYKEIKKNKIIIKIVAERIVIRQLSFEEKGYNAIQLWHKKP